MKIMKLFSEDEVSKILKSLEKCKWSDGKNSALGFAKEIKNNTQVFPDQKAFKPILDIVNLKLGGDAFKSNFFPKSVVGLRANRYTEGDAYGWHVDMAHMTMKRTDMSFTIFLEDKKNYDGGELDLKYEGFTATVKGDPGEMVVYPTGVTHRVRPVTRGTRTCIIGWIESLIPSAEDRDLAVAAGKSNRAMRDSVTSGQPCSAEDADLSNQAFYRLLRRLTP